MSVTTKNLGFVLKQRGEYVSSPETRYYKDNVVQYHGSSYIANPTDYDAEENPYAYVTSAPVDNEGVLNEGWKVFASGNNKFTTGESVDELGIDQSPQHASSGLITSKAVALHGSAFDISEYNKNGNTLATYTTLADALAAVPAAAKRGGMSIKFIHNTPKYTVVKTEGLTEQPTGTEIMSDPSIASGTYEASQLSAFSTLPATLNSSLTYYLAVTETVDEQEVTTYTSWVITYVQSSDNKYIQARCMAQNFTTDVTQWQGVDEELKPNSKNLAESGVVFGELNTPIYNSITLENYINGYIQTTGNVGESEIYRIYYVPCVKGDKFKLSYQTFSSSIAAAYGIYSAENIADISSSNKITIGPIGSAGVEYDIEITSESAKWLCVQEHYGYNVLQYGAELKKHVYRSKFDLLTEEITNLINSGYVYAGLVEPTDNHETLNINVFYFAKLSGTYTNFGNIVLPDGISIIKWDGSTWSYDILVSLDDSPEYNSNNVVRSGGIYNELYTNIFKTLQLENYIVGYIGGNGSINTDYQSYRAYYFPCVNGDSFKLKFQSFTSSLAHSYAVYSAENIGDISASNKIAVGPIGQAGTEYDIQITSNAAKWLVVQEYYTYNTLQYRAEVKKSISENKFDLIKLSMLRGRCYKSSGNTIYDSNEIPVSCDIIWDDGVEGTLSFSNFNEDAFEYTTLTATYETHTIVYNLTYDSNGYLINETFNIQ